MCYDISFTVNVPQLSDYFPDLVFDDQLSFAFDGTHIIGHAYALHPIMYRNRHDRQLHCTAMEWRVHSVLCQRRKSIHPAAGDDAKRA